MPDTPVGRDYPTAWAPKLRDGGMEWREVSYPQAIVPTELRVYETCGPGSVTKIEAWDEKLGQWVTLWEGKDPTRATPGVFSPPLPASPAAARTFRICVDTSVPEWNELDAVELVGNP